jgi:hypothetical protein
MDFHSTATMASRSRRFRFPRKDRRAARSRAMTRIAGAEFGAAGSRGETFPGCKALKSHEMGMESADLTRIGGPWCWRHAPAGSRSCISRESKITVDESTRGEVDGKFSAPQPLGIVQNRLRISETPPPGQRSLSDRRQRAASGYAASGKWHATCLRTSISRSAGASPTHRSCANAHRVA